MKKIILILLAALLLFAVGCSSTSVKSDDVDLQNEKNIEQNDRLDKANNGEMKPGNGRMDIELENLDTSDFSQEQLDMLEKYENGEVTMPELVSNGVFTREELGIGNKQGMLPPKEDLNLEGLSQEQLDMIDKLYNEEITLEELIDTLTAKEIEDIGLRGARAKTGPNQNSDK